jgi:hypothetical protein
LQLFGHNHASGMRTARNEYAITNTIRNDSTSSYIFLLVTVYHYLNDFKNADCVGNLGF